MKQDAFRYTLSPKEMQYLLFKKKVCPICGNAMTRRKDYVIIKGSELTQESYSFFRQDANVKDYKFSYYCDRCNKQYPLEVLANENKRG